MKKLSFILLLSIYSCKLQKESVEVKECIPSKECELYFTIQNSNQEFDPFVNVQLLPNQGIGAMTDFSGKANFSTLRPINNEIKVYINQLGFGDSLSIHLEKCKSEYQIEYTIPQWVTDSILNMPPIEMKQIRYEYSESGCRAVFVK